MKKIFLSVIIPCYNESENLKRGVLTQVYEFLKTEKFDWEVLVSDDGSSDESKIIVKKQIKNWKNFRFLENPHGGKPSALWYGIKKAGGKFVLFSDMDQSTPIDQLTKLLPFISEKVGAVIGSRGLVRKNFPLYRKIGSIVFMAVRKLFILPEIDDTQCGFKLFQTKVVKKVFPMLEFFRKMTKAKGWTVTSWDVELLHIIKKMGYTIEEVPVFWEDIDISKGKGGSLKRYLRESKEMIIQITKVKLNDIRGIYGP
ncbi:hypothetical protein A2962_03325 [Candidatus Woesebacteria bacterium RIFCSPLOWO2_01_FULL_39_61]|uniref:Glycosyltransferase 2-like domain-containing protein n=1 Tax=Candidatus Woesebacteria bacterium RIFCSPHIGHO2_02_FULL_39_13 TaxID=1802505 RepID=A0A1F7Z353_9BACT|nr:MAG: hypothetical protein A2692_04410 [Candidatus Woesebacteria bacterium RIFCSPHIGHO2_01_FULL_39_95]OGM33854.1 MAG: hypothetical protein A3D01_02695 [Candidatus Woesebacteria bacterium RIFCSPHIGHO2_02_FULL_39_13]OGM39015.1 MAG: hypothetical protein A3E13_04965 [Candidatus Woesebacteria bacterium RIFCSPHIGHO2_12_FULL_40_20]OGM67520.1 MAG: hypothetical protein A2962_03325 [Candidatus Woesebacteria bacterium RIFCSPLOWO2_01_FULL_39_61]OGM72851.1 MAG: hypothetical protein A3H19_05830 [Candidatus